MKEKLWVKKLINIDDYLDMDKKIDENSLYNKLPSVHS